MLLHLSPLDYLEVQAKRAELLEEIAYLPRDFSATEHLYEDVARSSFLRGQLDLVDSILSQSIQLQG